MKITKDRIKQIIKEELSKLLKEENDGPIAAYMAHQSSEIPGINPGKAEGLVLVVKSVENGLAHYGIYWQNTKIRTPDGKVYDNAYSALRDGGKHNLQYLQGGVSGEGFKMPLDKLEQSTSRIA
jgi:hypothetical protein